MTRQELFAQYGDEVQRLWYFVGQNEKTQEEFLSFAKDLGCVWMDGCAIKPETDGCAAVMGISIEGKIGQVAVFAWSIYKGASNANTIRRIDFKSGRWMDEPKGE